MTDFSHTARHLADGRAAAERLVEQLGAERDQELAELTREAFREAQADLGPARATTRLWDRRNRVA